MPLRYGARQFPVLLSPSDPGEATADGQTPQSPIGVELARDVIAALHIRTEPVYRLRLYSDCLEIGPVLGLLLGNRSHWYDDTWLGREAERVTEVYPTTGGLFCAFSPRNVSFRDGCAYGLYYSPEGQWRFGAVPLPAVAHRRSFHNDPSVVERLRRNAGINIFNSRRFDKWELHGILQREPALRPHLPETILVADGREVPALLHRHGGAVLKPAHLSRGRGIVFVDGAAEPYGLTDCRRGRQEPAMLLTHPALINFIYRELAGRHYICQQRIDLAQVGGAPFDVRVVMQRSARGRWQCQGIECRVAGTGQFVTNIARGGRALSLDAAISLAFGTERTPEAAEADVLELCMRLCHQLDRTGESFGELGVDVALDRAGKVWLLEANVLPTFKGFQTLDPATYRRILAAPMLYASGLAGFGEEDLGEVLQN